MKLSSKLLSKLTLGLTIPSVLLVPLASCSKEEVKNKIKAVTESTTIVGSSDSEIAYFTYYQNIDEGSTITVTAKTHVDPEPTNDEAFTFEASVSGHSLICVKVSVQGKPTERIEENLDLTFTCKNASGKQLWEETYSSYKVVYSPYVTFTGEKTSIADYGDSGDKSHKKYVFNLDTTIPTEGYTTKVELIKNEAGSKGANVSFIGEPIIGADNITIDVEITGLIEGDSHAKFDVVFTLFDSLGRTVYTPFKIYDFDLTYAKGESVVTQDAYTWVENANGSTLTAFDETKVTDANNALELPARSPNNNPYTIADGVFLNNDLTSKIPDRIKTLKIDDITAATFSANCFLNAPFGVMSLENQKPYEERAVKDISTIKFGAKSLQFKNAISGSGKVVFGTQFSQTKDNNEVVALEKKFWGAGLKSPDWYEGNKVTDTESFKQAIEKGGNVWITNDIVLTESILFDGVDVILNLYGHKITTNTNLYDSANKNIGMLRVHHSKLTVFDSTYGEDGTKAKGAIIPCDSNGQNGQCAIEIYCEKGETTSTSTVMIFNGEFYGNKIDKTGPYKKDDTTNYHNNTVIYNQGGAVTIKSIYDSATGQTEVAYPEFKLYTHDTKKNCKYILDCDDDYMKRDDESGEQIGSRFIISAGRFYITDTSLPDDYPHYFHCGLSVADQPNGENYTNHLASGYTTEIDANKTYWYVHKQA